MSRRLVILLLACLLSFPMTLHARKPTTRLVCDIWPPYQMVTEKGLTGFSIELILSIYAEMGVSNIVIDSFPWKRALTILEQGKADALLSANFTADRKLFARYPDEPLISSPWILWSRKGAGFESLHDIKGKRVGVVIGYSYTKDFWEFIEKNCIVEKVTADSINFNKLAQGRIDCTVAEYGNGLHLVREHNLKNVSPLHSIEIKRDGLYIIFSRDTVSKQFVQDFSRRLKKKKDTETYSRLKLQYFGSGSPF